MTCAKDLTILSVAGRYKQPVQYGRESAHTTCTRINTSARRRTRPSAGPERSQQLQILPSLNSKAVLQRVRLLFLLRQHFYGRQYFSRRQVFSIRQRFWIRQVFWMRQCFWIRRVFWMRQCFWIRRVFWMRQCFWIRRVFWTRQCFVYFTALTFLYIFLRSYLVCANNLIGANV